MQISSIYANLLCIAICATAVHTEEIDPKLSLANLAHHLVRDCKIGGKQVRVKDNSKIKVGIVGAGIGGLYAATLLQDLGINYEILEADKRIGGRVYTYQFDKSIKNDYLELGAMRLPTTPEYDRVIGKQNWSLLSYINANINKNRPLKLIPFLAKHPNNVFYFNRRKHYRSEVENNNCSFGFSTKEGGFIDPKYTQQTATFWEKNAFDYVLQRSNMTSTDEYLLKNDFDTFRSFLTNPNNRDLAYTSDVVDWIENFSPPTGSYSFSFMDGYLTLGLHSVKMATIDGGISKLVLALSKLLKNKPKMRTAVTCIQQKSNNNLKLHTSKGVYNYTHLIVTPTFQVLRDIEFDCQLSLRRRRAMASLTNSMAMKIGFEFKTRFWENKAIMKDKPIFGGASLTDLKIRHIIYPSYGINCASCRGTLIVSYATLKDVVKFLAFSDDEIAAMSLKDLAEIHGPIVYEQYTGKFKLMNWSRDRWTQGGFTFFEPGYYEKSYPHLIQPEGNGRVHFAGDTMSIYHGWIIGAVVSAYRAVKDILTVQAMSDKIKQLETNWGTIDEPDLTNFAY